ncbi:OadG family protein [Microbulbifer pacificus]|uniref:OadG family protein n=1 Tax=Microbulbifer pacificus TaxID=407164 RepID=UPI000CF4D582|nr:OadG family transporter subunit [Microbulbifer pacificus]
MQQSLLQQGLDITLFGMGIVFTFLLLLVICTSIMSRAITRFFPEPEPVTTPVSGASPDDPSTDKRLRKIIEAAIAQHRNKRR